MRRRAMTLLVLATGLVGCREEVEEIPVGLRGEARANPLLAAQRTLERFGVTSEVRFGLNSLPEPGEILLTEEGSLAVEGVILDSFLGWVEAGGDAIVCLDGFDMPTGLAALFEANEDLDDELGLFDELTMPWLYRESALLDELDLYRYAADEPLEVALGFEVEDRVTDGAFQGAEGPTLVERFPLGEGSVAVMTSGHFFNNLSLGDAEHAALLAELVGVESGAAEPVERRLVIAYASAPGLWSLLTERAPHVLWAALILLVVWLWRSWPRFGPIDDFQDEGLAGFRTHAAATGRYLWNHDRGPTLLRAQRTRTLSRLRAGIPGGDAMAPAALCQAIADKTGHDAAAVELALFDSGPLSPDAFIAVQRTLTQLGQRT